MMAVEDMFFDSDYYADAVQFRTSEACSALDIAFARLIHNQRATRVWADEQAGTAVVAYAWAQDALIRRRRGGLVACVKLFPNDEE